MSLVRDGRARGVVLQNGDELHADIVASNLDPKATFLKLIEPAHLDAEFRASIEHFRVEGTSLKMNLALDGSARFHGSTRALLARSMARPCTSARRSITWSAPGTMRNTAGRLRTR